MEEKNADEKLKIGYVIANLRYQHGYTQATLAEKLNYTKSAIGLWETNKRSPSLEMLVKLANIFDVTTDYLLSRSSNASPSHDGNDVCEKDICGNDDRTLRLLNAFKVLDDDYKDMLLGEAKRMLKQQQLEEKNGLILPQAKAT